MNPVFVILVIAGAILLWFLLSPLFGKIGDKSFKKGKDMFGEEETEKQVEEEKENVK